MRFASVYQTRTTPPPRARAPARSFKNLRGRKASESSKAPRKGSAARGKSTRSDSDSFSKESDGIFTLFIGAGIALVVAAVSSGGGRGHGRRRDVVRQRTATRAAKTVGSYVEPPQRTAVASLLLHVWGNLKRYYMIHMTGVLLEARDVGYIVGRSFVVGLEFFLDTHVSLSTEPRGRGGVGCREPQRAIVHPVDPFPAYTHDAPPLPNSAPHPSQNRPIFALIRSGMTVSSHAITTATLARTLLFTTWASVLVRIRAARDSARSTRAVVGGKASVGSLKKTPSASQGGGSKQRSKKNAKKTSSAPAPPRLLVREDTSVVTPPGSPPAVAARPVVELAVERDLRQGVTKPSTESGTSAAAAASMASVASVSKPAVVAKAMGVSPTTSTTAVSTSGAAAAGVAVDDPIPAASRVVAAEKTVAGVPFPDVMTAAQVQAMVEEDERAWEQAFLSEKLHNKADAAAAAASVAAVAASAVPKKRTIGAAVVELAGAGWSEVGGSGSRGRTNGGAGAGGGGRGRVLSLRNVRAAAQAARASSPGSDPATTTSASSSDSGEGCKDKPSHHHHHNVVESRGGRRAAGGRLGGRAMQGSARGSASAVPRAGGGGGGNKSSWGSAPAQSRGGGSAAARPQQQNSSRVPGQTRGAPLSRDADQTTSRPTRSAYAPWATATSRNAPATAKTLRGGGGGGGKPRNAAVGVLKSAVAVVEPSPLRRGSSTPGEPRPAAAVDRAQMSASSSARIPVKPEVSATDRAGKEVDAKSVEKQESQAPPVQPAAPAWTNTPSHPLGMHPEPTPLPPASEPPQPPPQHQQHWQRQQQREQHQQRQHQQQQQHQRFFHQQEPPVMSMSAAPVQQHQQHQDAGNHHYPPLPLPPQQPNHHHHHQPQPCEQQQQQAQQQHHEVTPQFTRPPDDLCPPPPAHMPVPAANGAPPPAPPAMIYAAHPAHMPSTIPSPGVSPGGGGGGGHLTGGGDPHFHARDGSYDSPGSGSAEYSADAATAQLAPPPHVMMLPSPYEQQQQHQQQQVAGRFSPPTLPTVPLEEGVAVSSALYGQQGPGPSSSGYPPASSGGGGSDGGEVFEALMGALRWQVEYYFSADNLVTDSYLRGLMDPDGFVAVSKVR